MKICEVEIIQYSIICKKKKLLSNPDGDVFGA